MIMLHNFCCVPILSRSSGYRFIVFAAAIVNDDERGRSIEEIALYFRNDIIIIAIIRTYIADSLKPIQRPVIRFLTL